MKSERLVILLSKEEKARIAEIAKREQVSMGELVRGAVSSLGTSEPPSGTTGRYPQEGASRDVTAREERARYGESARVEEHGTPTPPGRMEPSAEQIEALERLSEVALQTMQRANAALDKAFDEIEATKDHFTEKRLD
ncbi:MAG: hypothetical protein ACE5GS_16285 [Kiloniellaceae bacterium]